MATAEYKSGSSKWMEWIAASEIHNSCSPLEETTTAMWPGVSPGAWMARMPGRISVS